jgi:hypothetical protein
MTEVPAALVPVVPVVPAVSFMFMRYRVTPPAASPVATRPSSETEKQVMGGCACCCSDDTDDDNAVMVANEDADVAVVPADVNAAATPLLPHMGDRERVVPDSSCVVGYAVGRGTGTGVHEGAAGASCKLWLW